MLEVCLKGTDFKKLCSYHALNSLQLRKGSKLQRASQRKIDDEFAYILFRHDLHLTEHALDLILNHYGFVLAPDIELVSVHAQHEIRQVGSRYVRLDLLAKDTNGRVFNIEFQREPSGADPLHARQHAGMIDSDSLKPSESYKILPELYVIFITEKDYFKENEPVYYFEYTNMKNNKPLNIGARIVYVNCAYEGGQQPHS